MKTSQAGIDLIKRFEGFASTPYRCPAGRMTIGYGHVLLPHEHPALSFIDQEAAERLLIQDLGFAEQAVRRFITRSLTQPQFDALTCFTFNLGSGALQRSTLRCVINRGEESAVAHQWLKWVWAGGRKLPGLMRRRVAELTLYRSY